MKAKRILCIVFSLILVMVCVFPNSFAVEEGEEAEYVEGEILFKYEQPLTLNSFFKSSSKTISEALEDVGVISLTELDELSDEPALVQSSLYSSSSLDDGVYLAQIDGDVKETCESLENIKGVVYAEPNYIMHTDTFTLPTDLNLNIYKNYSKWYFDYMHITEAWSTFETAGEGTVVAVIDNGFYTASPDFPTNLWDDGQGNHGYNGYAESYDISPITDSSGNYLTDSFHGSNVAGVIGMASNGYGSIGAAYNAELMLLKSAGYASSSTTSRITVSAVTNCITYATNHGADIITMSISASGTAPSTLTNAINSAVSNGIAFFSSAGNSKAATSSAKYYPAYLSNVIGVMAIDKTDTTQLADFSNYDNSGAYTYYDVAAPGVGIVGCDISRTLEDGSTTLPFNIYSGTSQATPLVASCAALYKSKYPTATVDEIYEAIRNSPTKYVTTNSTVTTSTYNFKALDALELLNYPLTKPIPDPEISTSLTHVTIDEINNYIYGLDENFEDITDYIDVENGTTLLTPTANGNGTGSVLSIFNENGELYDEYTIVIYGDINGDCYADGQDAVLISCMLETMATYSNAQTFAANVDYSDGITEDDYLKVVNHAIGLDTISQY